MQAGLMLAMPTKKALYVPYNSKRFRFLGTCCENVAFTNSEMSVFRWGQVQQLDMYADD